MLPTPRHDRAAVITGASSGIGEALAREFVRRGHRVVLVARRADRLRALAGELGDGAAKTAIDGLAADRAVIVPGAGNRAASAPNHLTPRRLLTTVLARSHPGARTS